MSLLESTSTGHLTILSTRTYVMLASAREQNLFMAVSDLGGDGNGSAVPWNLPATMCFGVCSQANPL